MDLLSPKLVAGADATTPILECRNLSISYFTRSGEIPAVRDFNLSLMPGEAHGIVGESGCGKSTVALAIMNYLGRNGAIAGGQILFEGRDLATMTSRQMQAIRGARIAMVYQEPMASLNPSMTIGRQLAEVPIFHERLTASAAMDRAEAMLASVRLPDPGRIMSAYPHQISGGQQQRIVIAMALLSNPRLLLLDEPTTALDVTVEAGIVELIREISVKFGTSMIYISHNLGLIRETCDRITVMYAGEAVEVGDVDTVFHQTRHPYTRGLLSSIPLPSADKNARPLVAIPGQLPLPHERPPGCSFAPRCNHAMGGLCDKQTVPMHTDQTGEGGRLHSTRCVRFQDIDWTQAAARHQPRAPIVPGGDVLTIDHLTKHYRIEQPGLLFLGGWPRTIKANEDLTFAAREAETIAIVGESGCGKSTFAKVLMGLEEATSGSIRLGALELSRLAVEKRDAGTIGRLQMIFQNPFDTLNPSYSVGAQIARVVAKFGGENDKEKIRARVLELLDTVKLPRDFAQRKPRQLSGGQKQRIGIARAFAGNPKVIVADEPVSALDVSVQAAITELMMDIQRDHRTTMLFISHDLSVVRYIADRVVVMYLGRIMEQGTTAQTFAPPYHPYTEALLAAVPIADPTVSKRRVVLTGELPSATNPPKGCLFQTRCPYAMPGTCDVDLPPLRMFGEGHAIACHLEPAQLMAMPPVITMRKATAEAVIAIDRAMPKPLQDAPAVAATEMLVRAPEPLPAVVLVPSSDRAVNLVPAAGPAMQPNRPALPASLVAPNLPPLSEETVLRPGAAWGPRPDRPVTAEQTDIPFGFVRRFGAAGRPPAPLAATMAPGVPLPPSSSTTGSSPSPLRLETADLIATSAAVARAAAAAAWTRPRNKPQAPD